MLTPSPSHEALNAGNKIAGSQRPRGCRSTLKERRRLRGFWKSGSWLWGLSRRLRLQMRVLRWGSVHSDLCTGQESYPPEGNSVVFASHSQEWCQGLWLSSRTAAHRRQQQDIIHPTLPNHKRTPQTSKPSHSCKAKQQSEKQMTHLEAVVFADYNRSRCCTVGVPKETKIGC